MTHTVKYLDRGRPPQMLPNPSYPEGKYVDISDEAEKTCMVPLPYPNPNKNIGTWIIHCDQCDQFIGVTAAARRDDPHSVRIACKEPKP